MDMPNNDKVYLLHDDISYVELIRFSIFPDNHTNDIENFFLLFRIFFVVAAVAVAVAAAVVVVVVDFEYDYYFH